MSLLSLSDQYIIVARENQLDCYDFSTHYIMEVPVVAKADTNDNIVDVAISSDSNYIAVITSASKQLVIFNMEERKTYRSYTLPRSASKIRFTANNERILVADKSGDVLIYDIKEEKSGIKLLGHLSLLLDILQTTDERFIITCDRDEKIRISNYPNTYNIQTYCLGHREFVNHVELLPHSNKYLTSTSGDGTVKLWDIIDGSLCHTIDTNKDIDKELNNNFVKIMDSDGIEVTALPIVHYATTKLSDTCSILAVCVYSCEDIFIYSLHSSKNEFSHELEEKLKLQSFPTIIGLQNQNLYIYNNRELCISVYKLFYENGNMNVKLTDQIKMFNNHSSIDSTVHSCFETIKVLYKRKFDNVQEYQERKKQRLEKYSK